MAHYVKLLVKRLRNSLKPCFQPKIARKGLGYDMDPIKACYRFRNNFGIFQCELAKTGRNQQSHHMCKTGNTKSHRSSQLVMSVWPAVGGDSQKKCPKDLNENLDLLKKVLGTKSILP